MTAMVPVTEAALREELVDTCRGMVRLGLTRGTSGNVGVRCGDGFLVSPTGVPYDVLAPDQVVPMTFEGTHEGSFLPSSEWRFHRDILQARPELGAVVHTHSTHATAVAVLGRSIPAIHYDIAAAGGPTIRCAPYATFGTAELARNVLAALEDRRACLLAHHGVVAAGTTLRSALRLAELVEELARLYLLCLPAGEPPVLPDDEIARVVERYRTYGVQPALGRSGIPAAPDNSPTLEHGGAMS